MYQNNLNKNIEKTLLDEVGKRIIDFGFNEKPIGQSYYKKTSSGFWVFHLSFGRYGNLLQITSDVGIRIDELENLRNKTIGKLSCKEKKMTCSMGVELGNLSQGKPKYWDIKRENDIIPVATDIVAYFQEIGLLYFSKYADMKAQLEVLSMDTVDSWLYSAFGVKRAISAVCIAFVLGDMEKVKALIETKTAYLKTSPNKDELEKFLDFVAFLPLK